MFRSAQHDSYSQIVPLQQIQLCGFRHCLRKTNADADEAHGFSSAGKSFRKQRAKILQSKRETRALGSRPCEIVEFQFPDNRCVLTRRSFLLYISINVLAELF